MNSTLDMFGSQTTLTEAGEGAARILWLTEAMTWGSAVILALVMLFVALAWRAHRPGREWWVVGGGVLFPLVVIAALFVVSTVTLRAIAAIPGGDAPVIEITGHQFWWDIVHDPEGAAIRDANELVLPQGVPVVLELRSADVIHSFWVPSIAGKMDMIPGRENRLTVTATETGRFRGQCAEFCGLSHPLMAFEVVVVTPEDYAAYLRDLASEARDAVTPAQRLGRDVFLSEGCPACHTVRGVAETGRLGPDLSRVGGRASLGAGMWRMNRGTLAGWIADPKAMKPGADMPAYNHLSGPELRALAGWLETLE